MTTTRIIQDPPSPTPTNVISEQDNSLSGPSDDEFLEENPDQSKSASNYTDFTTKPNEKILIKLL